MKNNIFIISLISIILSSSPVFSDWPMYMGNQYLTGNNDEIVPADNKLNWVFAAPSYLFYPVAHKNIVFVSCFDKNLYAINEVTGQMIWKCRFEYPAFGSPVTWDDYVLVTAGDHIYSIDINTGNIYWSRKDGVSLQLSTPIVIDNIVYYGSRKTYYARYVSDGRLIWSNNNVKIFGGSPIYWNQKIYFISKDYSHQLSQILCLSATDGKLLWKQNIPSDPNIFTPVVYNGKVYAGSINKLHCFNASTGEPEWTKEFKQQLLASYTVFANDRIYLSLDNGKIITLNPENSELIDSFTNFNTRGANFILSGETLFIPDQKGALYSYQSFNKQINWKFQTDFTNQRGTLSSANGRIYLAEANKLYSLSTGILPSPASYIASAKIPPATNEKISQNVQPPHSPPKEKTIEKEKIEVNLKDNKNNLIPGEITVSQNNKTIVFPAPDGKTTIEVEKDKDFSIIASAKNYFVKAIEQKPEEKKKSIDISLDPIQTQSTYTFNNIGFKYNSAELTDNSAPTLKAIAKLFEENPKLIIEIYGHTDNRGDEKYNLLLSQRRADKVKEFLIKNGITDTRVISKGFGESKPIVPNDTDDNMSKNRRVEFKIK